MIALHAMLVPAAEAANIPIPPDLENYDQEKFPHWHVFCNAQLGAPMPVPDAHFQNARFIQDLTIGQLKAITIQEMIQRGYLVGYSKP